MQNNRVGGSNLRPVLLISCNLLKMVFQDKSWSMLRVSTKLTNLWNFDHKDFKTWQNSFEAAVTIYLVVKRQSKDQELNDDFYHVWTDTNSYQLLVDGHF